MNTVNPKIRYVCDPVMGDEGKLYVPSELVSVYREKVVPVASMLTPNQFEAELLTNSRIESEKDGCEACTILHAAGPDMVVITSIHIDGSLCLIGSHQKEKEKLIGIFDFCHSSYSTVHSSGKGRGDLTAALLLGWSNKYPDSLDKASLLYHPCRPFSRGRLMTIKVPAMIPSQPV